MYSVEERELMGAREQEEGRITISDNCEGDGEKVRQYIRGGAPLVSDSSLCMQCPLHRLDLTDLGSSPALLSACEPASEVGKTR